VVDARGQTLLPGLWEMHTHYSGVEFGAALLAAGITTARDCGGEFGYLVAQRDASEKRHAVGPRLLLAGLVDAGGLKAFGHVTAETPEEGRAVVNRYHDAGFQQIKLSLSSRPTWSGHRRRAHRLGPTVTSRAAGAQARARGGSRDESDQSSNYVNLMRAWRRARTRGDRRTRNRAEGVQFFRISRWWTDAGSGEMAFMKEVDVAAFERHAQGAVRVRREFAAWRRQHRRPDAHAPRRRWR
jgi:hypothetical protein